MKRKSIKRVVRKHQIVQAVFGLAGKDGRLNVSLYSIAKALELWPSPHLRGIVNELVEEGRLIASTMPHRPNVTKTMYALPMDEAFSSIEPTYTPVIKLKGKVV